MVTAKHRLVLETTGTRRGGNDRGIKGRIVGLTAALALGISLVGGIVGYERLASPAAAPAQPTYQLGPVARERELNLILEQNALPESPPANAVPGMLPGPAKSHGEGSVAEVGLRAYLDGEVWVGPLPYSSPTAQPAPGFGPQP